MREHATPEIVGAQRAWAPASMLGLAHRGDDDEIAPAPAPRTRSGSLASATGVVRRTGARRGIRWTWPYFRFCVMPCAVSDIFFRRFESVVIILESRSITICIRRLSISPISLSESRSFFMLTTTLSISR